MVLDLAILSVAIEWQVSEPKTPEMLRTGLAHDGLSVPVLDPRISGNGKIRFYDDEGEGEER
jgi:hypothetical protein